MHPLKTYIVITYGYNGTEYLSDLWTFPQREDVITFQYPLRGNSCVFLRMLRKIHMSSKMNRVIQLPMRRIWYCLEQVPWDKEHEYVVVFAGVWGKKIDTNYLNELQRKYPIKYNLLLLDSMASPVSKASQEYMKALKFDNIFSFDPKDSGKYGFYHTMSIYSIQPHESLKADEVDADLYFIGNDNGRFDRLMEIYRCASEYGGTVRYRLMNVPRKKRITADGIAYCTKRVRYSLVVEETMRSNCILEMLRVGQSGATQRYYEAVCYNKKLLTNNKNVVNLPFYDPNYMYVFEKPEDIDWDWVKERLAVDYHYDGRFSPIHLIDKIIELEEEKERRQDAEKETP